jgi:hypothetical protein
MAPLPKKTAAHSMGSSPVNTLVSVLVLAFLGVSIAKPAHAYLDPGTGSIMLQAALAGVAGAVVILRLYLGKLKALLGLRRPPALDSASNSPIAKRDA